jgi:hypothetical protein
VRQHRKNQGEIPYADGDAGNFKVNCNIVLKTTDRKAKIIARVFSTALAFDAMSMTRWQTLAFVFRWWRVSLMTNPCILQEARILWAKKLQIYYRPEVMKTSIGRQESREEATVGAVFPSILRATRAVFAGRPSTQLHVCSRSSAGYA